MFVNETRLNVPDALNTFVGRAIDRIDEEMSHEPDVFDRLEDGYGYKIRLTIARHYTRVEYESPDDQPIRAEDIQQKADGLTELLLDHADELAEQTDLSRSRIADCTDLAGTIRDRFADA